MCRTRRFRSALAVLALATLLSPPLAAEEIELAFLNTSFENLDSAITPVEEGPFTIRFSSPRHRLTVHRNRLRTTPLAPGLVDAEIEVELEGNGILHADVEGGGVENRFTDAVVAPRQTVRSTSVVRLERDEGGYLVTLVEPGPPVAFEISSAVGGEIVGICRVFALLPLFDLGCERLERALGIALVPLPEPGTRLLLPAGLLNEAERGFFDRLIAGE